MTASSFTGVKVQHMKFAKVVDEKIFFTFATPVVISQFIKVRKTSMQHCKSAVLLIKIGFMELISINLPFGYKISS